MLTSRCGTDFHWSIFLCLCLNHLLYEDWSIVHWLPRCKHTLTVGALNQTSGQGSSADVTQQLRDTLFTLITVGESWRTVTVQTLSQNYWVFSRFSLMCSCAGAGSAQLSPLSPVRLMTDVREVPAVLQPDWRTGVPATHLPGLTVSGSAVSLDGNQQLHCNIPTGTTCWWLTELTLTLS